MESYLGWPYLYFHVKLDAHQVKKGELKNTRRIKKLHCIHLSFHKKIIAWRESESEVCVCCVKIKVIIVSCVLKEWLRAMGVDCNVGIVVITSIICNTLCYRSLFESSG